MIYFNLDETGDNTYDRVDDDHKRTSTILVQKIPPSLDEEFIEIFFDSTKKKGGGPVKQIKLVREKNWATVEFCEPKGIFDTCIMIFIIYHCLHLHCNRLR